MNTIQCQIEKNETKRTNTLDSWFTKTTKPSNDDPMDVVDRKFLC